MKREQPRVRGRQRYCEDYTGRGERVIALFMIIDILRQTYSPG